MVKLSFCIFAALSLVALPDSLVVSNVESPNHSRLIAQLPDCTPTAPIPHYTPEVRAPFTESVTLACQNGILRVFRFYYDLQSQGQEAVSSRHRIVPEADRQQYGSAIAALQWGNVQQSYLRSADGKTALSWYWYEIGSDLFADPKRVKLIEFLSALTLQHKHPEVFVAQWFPANDNEIFTATWSRDDIADLIAQVAGY